MVSAVQNTDEMRAFMEGYKKLPVLWIKTENAGNRWAKNKAWESLLEIYKKIDPNANLDSVKKRIINLRGCYRRELKKVVKAENKNFDYIPQLWYFKYMDFLRNQELNPAQTSEMAIDDESQFEEVEEPLENTYSSNDHFPKSEIADSVNNYEKTPIQQELPTMSAVLKDSLEHMKYMEQIKQKDESRVYSESWATAYRKLSATQQIYAKRAIEEILILGQLDLLTFNTINPPSIVGGTSPHGSPIMPESENDRGIL